MKKKDIKEQLLKGKTLSELFEFKEGQECMIYKGDFEISDEIIYIPDLDLNEIRTAEVITPEEIDDILYHFSTGEDFLDVCKGNEKMAKYLFDIVDWQHPNLQDLMDDFWGDETAFEQEFGVPMSNF